MRDLTPTTAPAVLTEGVRFYLFGQPDLGFVAVNADQARELCRRCGGQGVLTEYVRLNGGTCYECGGACFGPVEEVVDLERKAEARLANWKRAEAKRSAKLAAADKAKAAELEHELVAVAYRWYEQDRGAQDQGERTRLHPAAMDCLSRMDTAKFTGFSDKQRDMVIRAVTRHEERLVEQAEKALREADLPDAPLGRQSIEGVVVGTKEVPDYYSYHGGYTLKLIVECGDGWKVYMTAPAALDVMDDDWKGTRVAMNVTLEEPSDGERRFRIGKRPAKARVLEPQDA